VASESTFSTSGRTLNLVSNSLSEESIEPFIYGQDWLRASVTGMYCLLSTNYLVFSVIRCGRKWWRI
jgi:hypothetical protein